MGISIGNSEISTATGIYCGSRKLRPDGGGGGWQPGANTIAYYKLETDANDYSGNGYNLVTTHTSPSFETYQGVNCAKFNGSNMELHNNSLNPLAYGNSFTVSAWAYLGGGSTTTIICNTYKSGSTYYNWALNKGSYSSYLTLGNGLDFGTLGPSSGGWYHLLFTCNNKSTITYVNGVQSNTGTLSLNLTNNGVFWIGVTEDGGGMYYYLNGGISNVIVEDKAWTADEVAGYYNQTKANYQPTLKSYSEITAMTYSNALTELNTYPTDYYNKFNSEGKMSTYDGHQVLLYQGSVYWNYTDYYIYYNNNMWYLGNDGPA